MQENTSLSRQLARAEARIAELRQELSIMRATRSWRLTAPLRFVYERLADRRPKQKEVTRLPATDGPRLKIAAEAPQIGTVPASFARVAASTEDPEGQGAYVLNDGAYWDAYVKQWEEAPEKGTLGYLGCEWKNQETFSTLLEKYAMPGGNALEIGCGGGRITAEAVRLFGHVEAADVSHEMLRKCRESVRANNLSLQHLDGFTLNNVPDSSIDVVYSHDVFVHFSSLQVYAYLEEIRRVLKSNGLGIISFYSFSVSFDLFKDMSFQFRDARVFPPHMRVHFITEEMVRKMLGDLGLEPVEVDSSAFLIVAFRRVVAG
jgi:ubiquinone/menaquinone biosynthesis C-methylase UbiE